MPGVPWTLWDSIALFAGLWMLLSVSIALFIGVRLRGLTSLAPTVERHNE
jgi:hypothetical protein